MKIVLANVDYQSHTSSEGNELQLGLEHAGWRLCGRGYDGIQDVRELLKRYDPSAVFLQDKRDWDPRSPGSFRKDVGFAGLDALRARSDLLKICVVKDAGSVRRYHFHHCEEVSATAVMNYYHERSVLELNPWLRRLPLIRTYHSIDADFCRDLPFTAGRKRAVVTGATSAVYPVRERVMKAVLADRSLGIDVYGHPGYHNRGHHTPDYLRMLSGYRVHVATASRYGFALRKLFESVSVGCTPVTNLPEYDVLPEINGALFRVSENASVAEVLDAVAAADQSWNLDERLAWAQKAWAFYDWRAIGVRLSGLIDALIQQKVSA